MSEENGPTDAEIRAAGEVLLQALQTKEKGQEIAFEILLTLMRFLFGLMPPVMAVLIRASMSNPPEGTGEVPKNRSRSDNEIAMRLIKDLQGRDLVRNTLFLLNFFFPRWMHGADLFPGNTPPIEEVKDGLLRALDTNVGDFAGLAAVFIGRYGPEAESVLPELMSRLRERRKDCGKAPGLVWAVYMIGGVRPEVRELLLEVAQKEESCPHGREIAQTILGMNQIPY